MLARASARVGQTVNSERCSSRETKHKCSFLLYPPSCYYILEGALAIVYTYRFQNARTRPHALASGSARPTHFSSAARDAPQTLLPKRSHSSTNCSSSASSATPAWAVRPNGREVRACARSSLKPPHGTRNTYLCFSLSLSLSRLSLSSLSAHTASTSRSLTASSYQ